MTVEIGTRDYFYHVSDRLKEVLPQYRFVTLSYLLPYYFTFPAVIRSSNGKPSIILTKKVVKNFLENLNQRDNFTFACRNVLSSTPVLYRFTNLTHRVIAVPSTTTLQIHCAENREKYKINLLLCFSYALPNLIEGLKKSRAGQHVGIIVLNEDTSEGHVVSVLCHFSQTPEFLVIDSSVENAFVTRVIGLSQGSGHVVHAAIMATQADNHSCRTGAVVMMRNILVFYNEEREYLGVQSVLNAFNIPMKESTDQTYWTVPYLPAAWTYTEQIQHPKNKHFQSAIHRVKYSKQKEKLNTYPDTVHFRKRFQREVATFEAEIYLSDFHANFLSTFPRPSNARIEGTTLIFRTAFVPNTYLQEKGHKNMKKLTTL